MENLRPESYNVINDNTRAILIEFYENGMLSTKEINKIKEAAARTGLDLEKIKKWIGNQNAKEKKKRNLIQTVERKEFKRRKGDRKLCGQNVFYSQLSKEGKLKGLNNAERNILVSNEWKNLSPSKKERLAEEATRINEIEIEEITENEKAILVKKHKRRLLDEISVLEKLGVESASILIDDNKLCYYGSKRGIDCLSKCNGIDLEFRQFFEANEKMQTYSYQDLQNLYNKEYAKAIGSKSAKVPYLKGNFRIEGLPDDIEWKTNDGKIKKPCTYGQRQIQKFMENKENVRIMITTEELNVVPELPSETFVPTSILKLVEEDVAKRAISGGARIEEHEMEVLPVLRDEEQVDVLSNYLWCFSADACKIIKEMYADKDGVVVPTFTDSPKQFWLFNYRGNAEDLNINKDQSIPGYWLQKISGQRYRIQDNVAAIKNVNIIKNVDGDVISCHLPKPNKKSEYIMDKEFTTAVKKRLADLGLQ